MAEKTEWMLLEDDLVRLFKHNGAVGGRYGFRLQEMENKCGLAVTTKFVGSQILCDSFKDFYIETFTLLRVPPNRPFVYADFVARHNFFLKQLRAAELLLLSGHPWAGYSLLRTLVEQAQIRCALLMGMCDVQEVEGLVKDQMPESRKDVRNRRKKVEIEIFKLMSGSKSGLSATTVEQIRKWDDMFDMELHGMRFSNLNALAWLKGEGGLPIFPVYDEQAVTMFVNRFAEVGWMLHRLLPALQFPPFRFSQDWVEKWNALDRSFHAFSKGMIEIGKPIGSAIIEFVTTKFPFNVDTTFPIWESSEGASGKT